MALTSHNEDLDNALLAGSREAEALLRRQKNLPLFALAQRRNGKPLVYWLEHYKATEVEAIRRALRHLFYRNSVYLYFVAASGWMTKAGPLQTGDAKAAATARREALFMLSCNRTGSRQAYSFVDREADGSVKTVSVLHDISSVQPGPYHNLLDPTGVYTVDGQAYAIAEHLEVNRLLFDAMLRQPTS